MVLVEVCRILKVNLYLESVYFSEGNLLFFLGYNGFYFIKLMLIDEWYFLF